MYEKNIKHAAVTVSHQYKTVKPVFKFISFQIYKLHQIRLIFSCTSAIVYAYVYVNFPVVNLIHQLFFLHAPIYLSQSVFVTPVK